MCSDVTGDRHAVQNRLDRLEVGMPVSALTLHSMYCGMIYVTFVMNF